MAADRNPGGLEQTKSLVQEINPNIETVTVDVSKLDQVERMVDTAVERFGRLDVLVNAAGVLILTPPLAEVDERHWDLMMSTNLKGLFFCCKAAIPAMLKKRRRLNRQHCLHGWCPGLQPIPALCGQ